MPSGKASIRFKSGAYTKYVSILNRIATQPVGIWCPPAITSGKMAIMVVQVKQLKLDCTKSIHGYIEPNCNNFVKEKKYYCRLSKRKR
jgi:hypothetical protein